MDKYERRRLRLMELKRTRCNDKAVQVAKKIDRSPTYVSRMLYPAGKRGARRIADDMMEIIEKAFELPRYWLDQDLGTRDQEPPLAVSSASDQTIELSKDDYTEIVNQSDTDEPTSPVEEVKYSESIDAVIKLMLTLSEAKQGYIHKAVVDEVARLTAPAQKDQSQKVDGLTGTHS